MSKSIFVLFVCLAWNLCFFGAIFCLSLNIPFFDDYDSLGEFILQIQTSTFYQKIVLLLGQYGEHRIVFSRLLAWFYFNLTNKLQFNFLVFLGMLGLIGFQVLFFLLFKRIGKSFFWFLPITFFLLNFQYWENLVSAMTALSNLIAPFFALLFCYIIAFYGFSFWAYFVTLVAIFTSGNGLLLLPFGLIFGLFTKLPIKYVSFWAAFSLLVILIYFSNYQTPPAVFGGRTPLIYSIQHIDLFFQNLILFLTSTIEAFSFEGHKLNYYAIGLISIGVFYSLGYSFFSETWTSMHNFLMLAFSYILGTAILVALFRGSEPLHMFFYRYRIYSSLFFCFIYLGYLYCIPRYSKLIYAFFASFSIVFFVVSFKYLSFILTHYDEMKYGAKTYHLNKLQWLGLYPPYTSYSANSVSISLISQELGRLNIYDVPFSRNLNLDFSKADTLEMNKHEKSNFLQIRNEKLFLNWRKDQFALLVSPKHKVLIPLKTQWSSKDLIKKILNKNTLIRGFEVHVTKHNLNHGNYDLYVFPDGKPYFVSKVSILKVSTDYYHN